ncbi:MAG: hypothetical protein NTZ90_17955 [Proteobacteria bacterium]|nr:hypothetical protein [Pseudomonadota bacterium]
MRAGPHRSFRRRGVHARQRATSCPVTGATAKPSPELYTDGVAFAERTGQLNDWRELLNLGMEPDTVGGGFFQVRQMSYGTLSGAILFITSSRSSDQIDT